MDCGEIQRELQESLRYFPELHGCKTVVCSAGEATYELSIVHHGWMCTHVYCEFSDILPSVVTSLCAAASMVADVEVCGPGCEAE